MRRIHGEMYFPGDFTPTQSTKSWVEKLDTFLNWFGLFSALAIPFVLGFAAGISALSAFV